MVNLELKAEDKNIVIVDDDDLVRSSLDAVLRQAGYAVIQFPSGVELLKNLQKLEDAHCLMLDVQMPDMNGIDVLEVFRQSRPDIPVVIMSGFADVSMAVKAMQAGARDFIEKPFNPKSVMATIERTLHDHSPVDGSPEGDNADSALLVANLTSREQQILGLLAQGMQNKMIARQLEISPRTVEVHRARIMQRMGVSSFAEMLRHYVLGAA